MMHRHAISYLIGLRWGLAFVWALLLASSGAWAQSIGELEAKLKEAKTDSAKVVVLRKLSQALLEEGKPDLSIAYANQALDLVANPNDLPLFTVLARANRDKAQYATSLNFYLQAQKEAQKQKLAKEQAQLNTEVGKLYKDWGLEEKAVEYLQLALEGWKALGNRPQTIDLLSDLIVGYQRIGNYPKALSYNQELLALYEEANSPKQIINALSNISNLHLLLQHPNDALATQQRILELNQSMQDSAGIASAYNNLGFLYRRLNQLEPSLQAFQQSLAYSRQPNPVTLVNIGVIYQVLGNYEPSLLSFFEAAKLREAERNGAEVARVCNYIAAVYQTLEDSENALRYAERAVQFGQDASSKETLIASYQLLSDIYISLGRNKRALSYYKDHAAMKDSLQEEERMRLQDALARQVDAERKEKDLKLLLVDQEINQLSLRKLQLETEKKEQDYQLQLRSQELTNAELRQKELEKESSLRALTLEKQRIEAEKKDREIAVLQTRDSLQNLTLRQKELEEAERQKDIELLKQREALQQLRMQEEQAERERERNMFWAGLAVVLVILMLILGGFILQRRANAKLRRQQEQIEAQNAQLNNQNLKLQEQADEITVQAEELMQQRDEIMAQRDYIEDKNKQLEEQRNAIQRAFTNIQVLSDIGQKITSTLDLSMIIRTVYESVNRMMDATSFGIGIYSEKLKALEFKDFIEKDEVLPYSVDYISQTGLPSVRCFVNQEEILINNLKQAYDVFSISTEDNRGEIPASLIYMPLLIQERTIGVITVQSFKENSYDEKAVTMLRSLASYASIALDNSHAYDQLKEVNEIINEKNQQITDSLRYARTIEESILPKAEWFDLHFADHFVIYRPKDIVSGDFYWAHEADGSVILATVDCTGHGVPGAFMSMIGNALLNRIVKENRVYDPATILDHLNTGVKEVLQQQDHDTSEGMDVCLCRIVRNGQGSKVVFAGAKRPLYYLLEGEEELQELKGDRLSVGWPYKRLHNQDLMFNNLEVDLPAGTQLYLTTDGYVDNPGVNRAKLGTPLFKKIVLLNKQEAMERQGDELLAVLEEATQQREQRDDITVIGIKLK
jgi:serine phosphatase RsbU (regulator of sigma subunit)/tetratricopeptide (TPR) repeat protein